MTRVRRSRCTRRFGSRAFIALAWAVVARTAFAADVPAGEYLAEGGWGIMQVSRDGPDGRAFTIDTRGANGHLCALRGTLVGDRGEVSDDGSEPSCRIRFDSVPGRVRVAVDTFESCRAYCGMRAGFDGVYERPADGCRTDQRGKSGTAFIASYRHGRYADALERLQPVLARCRRWLDDRELGRTMNDVAITQFHLGRRTDCLATLEPLRAEAELADDALARRYAGAPANLEDAQRVVAATRSNLARCRGLR